MRRLLLPAVAVVAALATACGGSSVDNASAGNGSPSAAAHKGSLVVADAGFTESQILAQMYAAVLTKIGYDTSVKTVSSSEIFTPSLRSGDIDVAPEYVATYANQLDAIANNKKQGDVASPSLEKSYAALQKAAGQLGLTALKPSDAVDQNAFAVTKDFAQEHNLTTLSDLGAAGIGVKLAATSECPTRPFCQPGLEQTYGIKITALDPLGFDTLQVKKAVQSGSDQLGLVSTTDATLDSFGLVILDDDKNLQNADNVVPIVNTKSLTPEIETALNKVSAALTTKDLGELDAKVDQQRRKPEDVAREYLTSKGLI